MESIFNKYNFNVLNKNEAEKLKSIINISYKKFPHGRTLYFKNLIHPMWEKYAELIYENFGPPSYKLNTNFNIIDIWVIASKKACEAFYIEYWSNSSPPYMCIFAKNESKITSSFLKWLSAQ